ncbi:adenosylcobinamide-GDP ribazoletransferase [Kordiimonas sp. SCSIO 12610]|uniref:adenosylcobinamide-GDP ribazoletransferase n=1 Tax=Kordiimonas sp. SCSIO 12610 TaxID=2829597 RepID=UPI00210B2693|nr:adenosylcobinamide-GDP ribazoletransferase [Kordiimonas sp. SCSIO 12610]UTW55936.1 adenosylcobinamide-GDP ribazoletransferase [Kordiimonas sp. SCSIO 12610]
MTEDKKTTEAEKPKAKPAARTTPTKAATKKAAPKKAPAKTTTKKATSVKKTTPQKASAAKKPASAKSGKTQASKTPEQPSKKPITPSSTTKLKAGSFGTAKPATEPTEPSTGTVQEPTATSEDVPAGPAAKETPEGLGENRLTMPEENLLLKDQKPEGASENESENQDNSGFNPYIIVEDIAAAMMLLTRIPVPWRKISERPPNLSRSTWAYPIVGLIIALIGASVYAVISQLNLSPLLAALIAILAMVFTTGAFHEDGLADMADGIGGGMTKDRKLEIMRDSRVGTYGAVALILSILIRAEILADLSYIVAIVALVVAAPLSRSMIVLALFFLPPAREKGLGTVAGEPPQAAMIASLILGCFPLILLGMWLPVSIVLVLTASFLGLIIVSRIAMKAVDGYTGDILGSIQQVSEATIMIAILIAYHNFA